MQVKLTWTLGSLTPPGQAPTNLTIQHRLSSSGTWITQVPATAYSTFCTAGSCQYTYPNNPSPLEDNKSYDFRILTDCSEGSQSVSNVVTRINVVCPVVTLTASSTTVSYSFSGAVSTSVTGYIIGIYLATDTGFSTPLGGGLVTVNSPVPSTISGTFSGLSSTPAEYVVRVTVKSSGSDVFCNSTIFTTETLPCNAASNLSACIVGVDCP